MGAWIGGTAQGVAAKNASKDQSRASNELTRRMEQSRQAYMERRPQVANEHMNALRNQLGLFNPANQMMGEMTGGRYQLDLAPLQQSPLEMRALQTDLAPRDDMGKPIAKPTYAQTADARSRATAAGYKTTPTKPFGKK